MFWVECSGLQALWARRGCSEGFSLLILAQLAGWTLIGLSGPYSIALMSQELTQNVNQLYHGGYQRNFWLGAASFTYTRLTTPPIPYGRQTLLIRPSLRISPTIRHI
jgi:hypothetical protein